MIILLTIACERCSVHESWYNLESAERKGWQFNEKTGECLCPICVWETKGIMPPQREMNEERLFSMSKDKRREQTIYFLQRIRETGILKSGGPSDVNSGL